MWKNTQLDFFISWRKINPKWNECQSVKSYTKNTSEDIYVSKSARDFGIEEDLLYQNTESTKHKKILISYH